MKQQKFLNQARHNEDFHNSLCREFEHSFFDWKITCLFYISIHYLKALAVKRNRYIGNHHAEINRNIKSGPHNPAMPISRTACNNYMQLFHHSQTARYDGFEDLATFNELKRDDYQQALQWFDAFKKFVGSSGVAMCAKIILCFLQVRVG